MEESNFGVETGKTICFAENIASLLIFMRLSPSPYSFFSQRIYMFSRIYRTELNSRNLLKKNHHCECLKIVFAHSKQVELEGK